MALKDLLYPMLEKLQGMTKEDFEEEFKHLEGFIDWVRKTHGPIVLMDEQSPQNP